MIFATMLFGALCWKLGECLAGRTTFYVSHRAGFYFRICGYGLAFTKDQRPLFSERMGYRKVLRIGRWAIQWLKRSSLPQSSNHD